jgi:hypothetical protein
MLRDEPEQSHNEGHDARSAQADGTPRGVDVGHTIGVFEQRIADDGQGQP